MAHCTRVVVRQYAPPSASGLHCNHRYTYLEYVRGRSTPGLRAQVSGVTHAGSLGDGELYGAKVGSKDVRYVPSDETATGATVEARLETAGAVALVLDAALPAIITRAPKSVAIRGVALTCLAHPRPSTWLRCSCQTPNDLGYCLNTMFVKEDSFHGVELLSASTYPWKTGNCDHGDSESELRFVE